VITADRNMNNKINDVSTTTFNIIT